MNRRKRGFVYAFSLLIIFFLTIAGTSLLIRSAAELDLGERFGNLTTAFHLADAAADQAINNLRSNNTQNILSTTMPGGTFWAELSDLGGGKYTISTHGLSNGLQRNLEVVVSVTAPETYPYAIFSKTTVALDSNATIDSYDSRNGSYGGSNKYTNGDVGTNSTGSSIVALDSNAKVKGDVYIGPGGNVNTDVTLASNAEITGSKYVLAAQEVLTPKTFPGSGGSTSLSLGGNTVLTLGAGTYAYTSVTLDSNAKVKVTGDATFYIDNTFQLLSNSQFITDCGTCKLTIYVKGGSDPNATVVGLDSNTKLSAGDNPTRLRLYVTGAGGSAAGKLDLDSNTGMYAAVHAPLSTIHMDSNATIYGAVVGNSIDMDSNGAVHYDEALASGTGSGGTYAVQVLSWRDL